MQVIFKEIASGIDISKLDVTVRDHEKVLSYITISNDINGAMEALEVLKNYSCIKNHSLLRT